MENSEEILKLLHDKFGWNLTNSLTNTGKKLVADTIKALSKASRDAGYEEAEKILYSEEEVLELLNDCRGENPIDINKWFEQFKKK
jgi:hypothetical protein